MTAARLLGVIALVALSACAERGDNAATGGTLVIAVPATWSPEPPALITQQLQRQLADQIYDRLAEIGPTLNTVGDAGFVPRLASLWTWAADSHSIAFHIDPRARWHDGRPVTAADVKFTFDLVRDPKAASGIAPSLANVDSVSARDSLTAVVWYARRSPSQFYDFVYQLHIMPAHVWQGVPRDQLTTSPVARAPVGTGRFRFGRFEPGVRVEIVADTANYRGRARLDRIIWATVPDGGTAVTHLLSGQADMHELLPPDVVDRVDSAATLRTLKYEGLYFAYLGLNARDPRQRDRPHAVLSDVRVRRAISMAMDRQAMLTNVFGTRGSMGIGPYPRALGDSTVVPPGFDRAHAAALLDSAGWRAGADGVRRRDGRALALGVIVPASSRQRMQYAVLIQEQLKAVGISVTVESMEFPPFFDRQAAGRFDMALMGTGFDPSPTTLQLAWSTSGIGAGGQNFVSYSNPRVDALLDSAGATFDADRARALYRRAFQGIVDDAPAVWLYDFLTVAGLHRRIRPEGLRADGWWVNLADWWIPEAERIERDGIGLRASP